MQRGNMTSPLKSPIHPQAAAAIRLPIPNGTQIKSKAPIQAAKKQQIAAQQGASSSPTNIARRLNISRHLVRRQ